MKREIFFLKKKSGFQEKLGRSRKKIWGNLDFGVNYKDQEKF